ncbi:MAG: hypothetical protein ABI193_23450 [Minicystis sp.]
MEKKRKRSERRAEERARDKLARDVEKLWSLGPGGSPARPLAITSPTEVEVIARSTRCPLCEGELRLDEHAAEIIGKARLRVAHVTCRVCRVPRAIYFELGASRLN